MNVSLLAYNAPSIPANSSPGANTVPVSDNNGAINVAGLSVTGPTALQGVQVGYAAYTTSITLPVSVKLARVNAVAGVITITLPPAATVPGQEYAIKKIDASANLVTVKGNGTELIDAGNTDVSLSAQYNVLRVVSNSVGWDKA